MSDQILPYSTGVDKLTEYQKKRLFGRIIRRCVLSKVIQQHVTTKCWLWRLKGDKNGYGHIRTFGLSTRRLHRVTFEISNGPAGTMQVCHHCDTPACCNPDHLFLGDPQDNTDDMIKKGRISCGENHWERRHPEKIIRGEDHHMRKNPSLAARGDRHGSKTHPEAWLRGEENPSAKLTEEKVYSIFDLREVGFTIDQISDNLDVGHRSVERVLCGETWKHLGLTAKNRGHNASPKSSGRAESDPCFYSNASASSAETGAAKSATDTAG